MIRLCRSYAFAAFLFLFAGCAGESVRIVLPDRHPANPSAAEVPFVPPPDPLAGVTLPFVPSRIEKPPEHRHGNHPDQMDDEMRMDDMKMDNGQSDEMMHGDHAGTGAEERKEQQR